MDAIVDVKDPDVSDFVKTISGRRLQIRDFAYNYTVDGDATEDYTAIGSERRYLKYDVVVDKFTTGTGFTLSQTPVQLKNGRKAISVVADGDYLDEVTAAPASGEYRVVGTTLTLGAASVNQVLVVYHANPAGNNWSDVSDPLLPVAIRGRDVKISISANDIARVQSVTVNGNMNTTPVKELGNRNVVGYQSQVPTVEGTISVLDTDTDLVSLLTYGVIGSGIEWNPGEGCVNISGLALRIQLIQPCDDNQTDVLKTIYIPNMTIVGDAFTSNVNGNATQNFNWRSADAQCLVFSGSY